MMKLVKTLVALALCLVVWESALRALHTPTYIFPKPTEILTVFREKYWDIFAALKITAVEAAAGLCIAVTLSSVFAIISCFLPLSARRMLNGLATSIQSIPLLAIAPLIGLWLGAGFGAKAAASAIVCIFPILAGWISGFQSVRLDHEEMFYNIGGTKAQAVRFLLIPAGLPFFFSGLKVAVPLAILGSIVGEFLGSSAGLGFKIMNNSYYVRTADMFAYIVVTAALGMATVSIIGMVENKVLFWRGRA